jgi:hypothetical protein
LKTLATSIYTYKYLKGLNLANASTTETALETMKSSYEAIKTRKSLSGGFKMFRTTHGSVDGIWLTSYVLQLLCEAQKFIEIDPSVKQNAVQFLRRNVKMPQSGIAYFVENRGANLRTSQGDPKFRDVYLTAFVMIAICKDKEVYDDFADIVQDAIQYLKSETILKDYEKIVLAYARTLCNGMDEEEDHEKIVNVIDENPKWNFLAIESVKAIQIEIASYYILACLKLDREEKAFEAFNWLMKQRKANGGFFSTHDTVLALQAISAMSERFGNVNPDVTVTFGESQNSHEVKMSQGFETKYVSLGKNPVVKVTAKGQGLIFVNVFAEFKTKAKAEKGRLNAKICQTPKPDGIEMNLRVTKPLTKPINMAVIDIEMPSGFKFKGYRLDGNNNTVSNLQVSMENLHNFFK